MRKAEPPLVVLSRAGEQLVESGCKCFCISSLQKRLDRRRVRERATQSRATVGRFAIDRERLAPHERRLDRPRLLERVENAVRLAQRGAGFGVQPGRVLRVPRLKV